MGRNTRALQFCNGQQPFALLQSWEEWHGSTAGRVPSGVSPGYAFLPPVRLPCPFLLTFTTLTLLFLLPGTTDSLVEPGNVVALFVVVLFSRGRFGE